MSTWFQDARHAARLLYKNSGSTLVALGTLAVGIGATTAIFSIVYSVLLKPLPFAEPERLVQIWNSKLDRGWDRTSVTEANFWDMRDMNRTFEDIGTIWHGSFILTGFGYPERLSGGRISAGFFRILGVVPVLGRTFLPGEDSPSQDNRILLVGNECWQTRFAANPEIAGLSLTLDGENYTVVGVLPAGEPWLDQADVYVPLVRNTNANRTSFEFSVIGRLLPGISIETARADLERVCKLLEKQYPEANTGLGVVLAPASSWVASDNLRLALWILLGAVGVLLLIACVNLANLLLAKATGRSRETAIRVALGGSRGRIARLVLMESTLLGLAGAGLGIVLAVWLVDLLQILDPGDIPRIGEVGIDRWVLAFTALLALTTGTLSGLLPALQRPYESVVQALREGERGVAGHFRQHRVRAVLVAAEVALSLALLVGAGLLIRSFNHLWQVDRGFGSESRLVFAVNFPPSYREGAGMTESMNHFLSRIDSLPQVISAAAVSSRPIVGGNTGMGIMPADIAEDPEEGIPWASWRLVTRDYFQTMGIPLLKGRTFEERDRIGEPWRAVISQRLADQLWPGEDPVGRQAHLWRGQDNDPAEIIGVVGNMRERGIASDPTLAVYLPYYGGYWSRAHFVVHTSDAPEALIPILRSLLHELDSELPISDIQTLDGIINGSVAPRRFNMLLLSIFAAIALALALAGIYGVLSYAVSSRTAEIGVRIALGASPCRVVALIVGQGMVPVLVGITIGLAVALAASRLMSNLLFGVVPTDPPTYIVVAALLLVAAALSSLPPALQAVRADPVTALRKE